MTPGLNPSKVPQDAFESIDFDFPGLSPEPIVPEGGIPTGL